MQTISILLLVTVAVSHAFLRSTPQRAHQVAVAFSLSPVPHQKTGFAAFIENFVREVEGSVISQCFLDFTPSQGTQHLLLAEVGLKLRTICISTVVH